MTLYHESGEGKVGTRYRRMHMESIALGKPMPWVAPPVNIVFADFSETMTNSFLAAGGTAAIAGGAQYLASRTVNFETCTAWGCIAFGVVVLAPITGDVLSDLMADIREGWERGHIAEPEPEIEHVVDEPTEDEAGAARLEGEWWYTTKSGRLCCYPTPRDKHRRPIITDTRMRAIFGKVLTGTPFSETRMTDKNTGVSGLSGPRFRMLQMDWRKRQLYVTLPDNSGYFTATGKIVAGVIANYKPPAPV